MAVWAPEDAEGFFRTFMDESPLAAWIVDERDRLMYASEPWPLREDQFGASMWDLVPEEYVAPYRAALHRARDSGETQVVTAAGPRRHSGVPDQGWFQAYYFPLPRRWVGGVGVDVTDLVCAREQLARSRERLVAAGDEARRRLERDLHDGLQQRLIVHLMQLRAVRQRLDRDPAAAVDMLEAVMVDFESAVDELRELARGIHPSVLTRFGLDAALRDLTARCSIPIRLSCSVGGRLPETVEAAAYFLCSESLTNMAKHAQAAAGEVTVKLAHGALTVSVDDDGHGGIREQRGGGLEGLRDRLEALGGSLHVADRPGGGSHIGATIPVPHPDERD